MRPSAVRILLATLLCAAIVQKSWLSAVAQPDFQAEVIQLLTRHGWLAYPAPGNPDEPLANLRISFLAAGCAEEGRIFMVGLGLQDTPMLDHIIGPGYTRRFVYLGRAWLTQDRMEMRLEWLKQKTLSLFGLGQYTVNEVVLIIAEPSECGRADGVDWSVLWRRV